MDVSIVLCTYNNAERLLITLRSLCQLNQPEGVEWELVAVNNNSTDDTEQLIESFSGRLPITYVYEPEQGKSCALNTGVDVAQGELIVFTDDDVKPNPDWLISYWAAYQDRPEGYYFGGPVESEFEGEPPDEDLLRVAMPSVAGLDHGSKPNSLPSHKIFIGANWACPSRYLRQVGGFDESLGLNASDEEVSVGEETDLMTRLEEEGIRRWYEPQAKIKHFVPKEKCTLDHIVSRRLAGVGAESSQEKEEVYSLLGVPVGLYRQAIASAVKWRTKKMLGREWKEEYLNWRMWLKRAAAFRRERGANP